jgi:hypothetical protein
MKIKDVCIYFQVCNHNQQSQVAYSGVAYSGVAYSGVAYSSVAYSGVAYSSVAYSGITYSIPKIEYSGIAILE